MKEKYLFVGGKVDGHVIEVNEGYSFWQVLHFSEFNMNDDITAPINFKTSTYRKITWESSDENKFTFFALENLSNGEVMSMILSNYQPFKQVEENKKIKRYEIMLERCVKIMENFMKTPFPSNKLMSKIYDLIYDTKKFLFDETNKN